MDRKSQLADKDISKPLLLKSLGADTSAPGDRLNQDIQQRLLLDSILGSTGSTSDPSAFKANSKANSSASSEGNEAAVSPKKEEFNYSQLAWETARSAAMFLPRNAAGMAISAVVYAAHDIDLSAPLSVQLGEAATGAGKGVLMNLTASKLGRLNPMVAGVALGLASRGVDTSMSYDTYFNKAGSLDLGATSKKYQELLDPKTAAAQIVTGVAAYGLTRVAGAAIGRALSKPTMEEGTILQKVLGSSTLKSVSVGAVASGSLGAALETSRELTQEGKLAPSRIMAQAALYGLSGGLSTMPGAFAAPRLANSYEPFVPGNGAPPPRLPLEQWTASRLLGSDDVNLPLAAAVRSETPLAVTTAKPGLAIIPRLTAAHAPDEVQHLGGSPYHADYVAKTPPRFETGELTLPRLRAGADPTRFRSEQDAVDALESATVPVRFYPVPGSTARVAVTEPYARKLDQSRSEQGSGQVDREAARRLSDDQLILPEHAVAAVSRLPDRGAQAKLLIMTGEQNPADYINQQRYKTPDFESAAATDGKDRIWLFRRQWEPALFDWVNHEWGHGFARNNPDLVAMQEQAARVEGTVGNDAHSQRPEELLPQMLERIMSPHPLSSYMAMKDNPLNTAVAARALSIGLTSATTPGAMNLALAERARALESGTQDGMLAAIERGERSSEMTVRQAAASLAQAFAQRSR